MLIQNIALKFNLGLLNANKTDFCNRIIDGKKNEQIFWLLYLNLFKYVITALVFNRVIAHPEKKPHAVLKTI